MPKIDQPPSPLVPRIEGLHLFHFDGAPCAQRVRFALGEKGLARGREVRFDAADAASRRGEPGRWVSRVVSLVRRDHMTPAYAEIHPNMVVPALVHDGVLYLESVDIIAYLDEAFGGPRLIPGEEKPRAATMERVDEAKVLHRSIRFVTFHWGLGRLAMLKPKEREHLADLARQGHDDEGLVDFYEQYSTRTIPEAVFDGHLEKLYRAFAARDRELADGRPFLMGSDVTIADAFWAMKVLRLIECGYPFAEHHPSVLAWYERVARRPSFRDGVMSHNRLSNRLFRTKAAVENLFGQGLQGAVASLATS